MPFVSFEQLCRYSDDLAENQARMLKAEADAKALREQLAACRALLREACEWKYDDPRLYDWKERARAAGGGE